MPPLPRGCIRLSWQPEGCLAHNARSVLSSVPHMAHTVRIWDLPTRLFHWCLVIAIPGLLLTANIGGNAMVWHFRLGYCVLTLLMFRLVWGFVGGRWSRFTAFACSPTRLLHYLRTGGVFSTTTWGTAPSAPFGVRIAGRAAGAGGHGRSATMK